MSIRNIFTAALLVIGFQVAAQDYSPFNLGHEWIYDIFEEGVIVGTDTMRCEEILQLNDTTLYHVYNYTSYTDGRPAEEPELNVFLDGFNDFNDLYARVFLSPESFFDIVYFKHKYVHLESYSNLFFTTTPHFIGDYQLPKGETFSDCFWLATDLTDSTGFVVAPDLGAIAAFEGGMMVRALKENNLPTVTSDEASICDGDSLFLHTRYIKNEGIYRDTLSGGGGNDSIVVTTVTVFPITGSETDVSICEGDSYFAQGEEQTEAGVYHDTLVNANGCDSIVVTNLTVLPNSSSSVDVTICEGESYFAQGEDQTKTGIYNDTLVNSSGCDSVVVTNLTVEVCTSIDHGTYDGSLVRVYPNPTGGMLYIESGDLHRIEIYNILGREVHHSGNNSFNFEGLPEGYYYVKCFDSAQNVTVRKVIYRR